MCKFPDLFKRFCSNLYSKAGIHGRARELHLSGLFSDYFMEFEQFSPPWLYPPLFRYTNLKVLENG